MLIPASAKAWACSVALPRFSFPSLMITTRLAVSWRNEACASFKASARLVYSRSTWLSICVSTSWIAREAEIILKPLGHSLDWLAFADAWRAEYQPAMEEIRSGRRPFVKLDILHRRGEELLIEDTAFHYFKRAGQTFRSELVLHGLHIGACTCREIVQHPHPMAAS
jgi:hypothetical protein